MVKAELVQYLQKTFLFEFDHEITATTDLFKAGIVDSYGYVQLIKFIQERFDVRLARGEFLSNLITTLDGLVALVERKSGERQAVSH